MLFYTQNKSRYLLYPPGSKHHCCGCQYLLQGCQKNQIIESFDHKIFLLSILSFESTAFKYERTISFTKLFHLVGASHIHQKIKQPYSMGGYHGGIPKIPFLYFFMGIKAFDRYRYPLSETTKKSFSEIFS